MNRVIDYESIFMLIIMSLKISLRCHLEKV